MPRIIENRLIDNFKGRDSFDRNELYEFYLDFEPDLKESTFSWRIYDLKKKDIIKTIGRGRYVISYKPKYRANPSENILKIARKVNDQFEDIDYCIWETQWLNQFSRHQAFNKIILVEIEREFVDSLYYYLNDNLRMDIYLKPDEKDIQFYISESDTSVVIQRLVTRAPKSKLKVRKTSVFVATLEKIMVDLFAEERLFHFYQGSEMTHIYENIIKTYSINFTKLFSYAKRRKKEQEIKQFMSNHLPNTLDNILNDRY